MHRQCDSRDIFTPFIGPCVAIWIANFCHSKTILVRTKRAARRALLISTTPKEGIEMENNERKQNKTVMK